MQTLASISAMGTFVYKGLQKREVPLRPKVFFVGTHKDQLDPKCIEDHVAEVDNQLQQAIMSITHFEGLVEFASPSQLMFTVNNFSKSDDDFRNIRIAVEQVITRNEFKLTSPVHWLIFSLALRKIQHPVASYDLCYQIAKSVGSEMKMSVLKHFISFIQKWD